MSTTLGDRSRHSGERARRPCLGDLSDILSPCWNRSKAVQAAAGEQLEQYLPMAEWPRCPHDYLSACPDHGRAGGKHSPQGHQNRCHAQSTQPLAKSFYLFRASFKLERARSSAPQLSRACNDIKQADCMRWLGENHDSTALKKSLWTVILPSTLMPRSIPVGIAHWAPAAFSTKT